MNFQQFPELDTHAFEFLSFREVMNVIRTLFFCLHVFEHCKNVC